MSRRLIKLINDSSNSLPAYKKFCNDVIRAMEQMDRNNSYKGSNYYKPSCLHCMRQMYFIRTEAQQDETLTDYQMIGMSQTGTARHESIQDVLMQMKGLGYDWEYLDVERYVKEKQAEGKCLSLIVKGTKGNETHLIDKDLKLSFRCDGIVKRVSTKEYYLFEFKNVVSFKFNKLNENALEEHLKQVICYCTCLDLDRAFITYENRDLCQLEVPEEVLVSKEDKENLRSYLLECEQFVEDNVVPPKCEETKFCRYCNYKGACKSMD